MLRPDGLFWLNLGFTFAAHRGYQVPDSKRGKDVGNSLSARVPSGYKRKDLIAIPWLVGLALQRDGWWLRSAPPWLCVNKLPESVKDRLTSSHEYWLMFSKSEHYYFDIDAVRIPYEGPINRWGGVVREEEDTEKVEAYREEVLGGAGATSILRADKCLRPDPTGRQMRTSDFWYHGLDVAIGQMKTRLQELEAYRDLARGMLLDEEGRPVALAFPTKSYHGAHFATYSPLMLEPIIKASTCERGCCPQCGAPWVRIVEKGLTAHDGQTKSTYPRGTTANRLALLRQAARERGGEYANTARTVGWRPSCSCGCPEGVEPDGFEVILSPTGERIGDDPTMFTGRAGYDRPRGEDEGQRPITRYEQRRYAAQLANSPHRAEMEAEAGDAFAHYIRTDRSGARPPPSDLLEAWLDRGWIDVVHLPEWQPPDPVPAVVLDPFVGSGSTLVMAHELGRRGIGLDWSFGYLRGLARPRLSLDALASWRQGLAKAVSGDEDELAELPLFSNLVREGEHG